MPTLRRIILALTLLLPLPLLGGCYYSPYGYGGYPGYGPPVVAPVAVGYGYGYYGRHWWR